MKRKMNVILVGLILLSLFVTACSGGSTDPGGNGEDPDKVVQLRVGGAPTTSWIYGCLVTISEVVKQKDNKLELIIQSTPGSTTHYGMMQNGELELGSGYTPTDYWATNGTPPLYDRSYEGFFYSLVPVTVSSMQIIVKADSNIYSISDLAGRKVFVGDPGAASTAMTVEAIELLGLDCQQIQTDRTEGFEMLKEGRVDVAVMNTGVPYSVVLELISSTPVRLIPFSDEEANKVIAGGPYNSVGVITPKDYTFLTENIQTLQQVQNLNINPNISDDIAYRLTKTIWENWGDVVKAVPAAGKVTPESIVFSIAPVHPGAIKYYEEIGVQIPDHLRP